MDDLKDTLRDTRAARTLARRQRARAKSLRAWNRAQNLVGRKIRQQSQLVRARVLSDQLVARLRARRRARSG